MCDVIQFVRIFLFVICWVLLVSAVLYASAYSKKNGINMNAFSGMLEVWGKVFKFESRKLSILLLTAAYGGAAIGIVILALTVWGQSHGCDFKLNYRSMR
ncbi:hypothetical protein AO392_20785 [Pseudomonas putida]|nr:hypothetical protein AO392_20785 [Pseudomonas putida]